MKPKIVSAQQLTQKIIFIYAFLGSLWIFCSDQALNLLVNNKTLLTYLQIIKGWGFILLTSWLLHALIYRKQRQLHYTKQQYRTLLDNAVEGIYQVLPDGRYINANLPLARLYGYSSPEELIANLTWQKLDADPSKRLFLLEKMQGLDTLSKVEFEVYRQDGSIIFTEENIRAVRDAEGHLLYYQGTVQNISKEEDIEAEEVLPEPNNNVLRAVIEGMADAVFVKNLAGQYMIVNQAGANFLGKPAAKIIGKHDWELFPAEIAQKIRQSDRRTIASKETQTSEEFAKITGKRRIFIISKSVYRDPQGHTLGLISIARDITDYKQVEQERSQLLEQLKRDTQDLAALTEITANAPNNWSLDELLDMLLKQIMELLAADTAAILLENNGQLAYTAGIGLSEEVSSNYKIAIGEGFAGTIAATVQPLYVEDTLGKPSVETLNLHTLQYILQLGIHTMLGVPLKHNDNCIGVIHLGWRGAHPYSDRETHLLEITAERCAMAIVNAQLYEQTQQLQKLRELQIERMPIGFILTDNDFRFLDWNPAAEAIFGFSKNEILGQHFYAIVPASAKPHVDKILQRLAQGDMTAHSVNENVTKNGHIILCEWRNTPLKEADGKVFGHLLMVQDITERKRAQEERIRYAFYDPLTGLPNRAWFLEHLAQIINADTRGVDEEKAGKLTASSQLPITNFAVLFLNLDRFEIVKSSLGHLIVDKLLITTVCQLQACLRSTDKVAYLGRDEFVILLEDIEDASVATSIADRIYQQMTLPFNLDGHEIYCTSSIGIAVGSTLFPLGYERPEDFLRAADTAMYQAKKNGGPVIFEPAMQAQAVTRLQLDTDLRRAIEREEFKLEYQPIISLQTGKIIGFEALVRWLHPTRGLVSPCDFIPVAEETRLIISIGQWVLRSACRQLRLWQRQFGINLTMSVNLSPVQLEQPNLVAQIDEILEEIWLTPNTLKLEITESSIMTNTELAIGLLKELKNRNIQLCIDDFGTGYSSLSYLHRFPIDTLKIDRSFVSRIAVDRENLEIVRITINLAHNLGMNAIAEGVENLEQVTLLLGFECEYGQGYFFSKPLNSQEASILLEKHYGVN